MKNIFAVWVALNIVKKTNARLALH